MLIPKLIHQTIEDPNQLLNEYRENRNSISVLNPDWELRLYSAQDREDYIRTSFDSTILNAYLKIDSRYGAARADFFRYLVIYGSGGLYLDIKSTTLKPLDAVILDSDEFITANWPKTLDGVDLSKIGVHEELDFPEYQTWFVLSKPKNVIMEKVIEQVLRNIHDYHPLRTGVGKIGVLRTTGPIAYSKVVHGFINEGKIRVSTNDELGLRPTIFRIESSAFPFPNREKNTHYSELRIPVIKQSNLHSLLYSVIFKVMQKFQRLIMRLSI